MTSKEITEKLADLESEKARLENELLKAVERENQERQHIKTESIKTAICSIWKKYWSNDDWSEAEKCLSQLNIPQLEMWLISDIKAVLKETKLNDLENLKEIVSQCNVNINWTECIEDAEIRLDFASALRDVKYGSDLSEKIKWGFTNDDLLSLMKLHKSNKFRRKIEELLTDCNFHHECGLLSEGKYDEYKRYVLKED